VNNLELASTHVSFLLPELEASTMGIRSGQWIFEMDTDESLLPKVMLAGSDVS